MINLGKKNLLGVHISAVDYDAAVHEIVVSAKSNKRCTVTALAVHGVMTGVFDPEHRYRLNHLDLVVPDGQPVRWGIRLLHGANLPDRVYGPNLMLYTCKAAAEHQLPIFLFGGTLAMLEELAKSLQEKFPNLVIAGIEPSKFRQVEKAECDQLVERIRSSGAKITFAGIGCPRQEVWAYEMGDQLQMPLLAVGAAFAFHSGNLSQAPKWMQRFSLEWLYRFACEPRRLWKRYVLLNPSYLWLLSMQKLGIKKFLAEPPEPKSSKHYG